MPVSQNPDRNKEETPEQQRNGSAVAAFSICHSGKHTGHGHKEAAGEEAGSSEQFHAIKESPKIARVLKSLFFIVE